MEKNVFSRLLQSKGVTLTLVWKNITDSTNDDAIQADQLPVLCMAAQQSRGRGRRGNQWHARAGDVLLSLGYLKDTMPPSVLSLQVACTVVKTLNALHAEQPFRMKWPNDIWWTGEAAFKVGGILIESVPEGDQYRWVIGLGLNHASNANMQTLEASFESLTAALITALHRLVEGNEMINAAELNQWHWLKGKHIDFIEQSERKQGVVQSIESDGALMVMQEGREVRYTDIHTIRAR